MAKMDYTKVEKMIERAFVESTMRKLLRLAELMESFGMPSAVDMRSPVPHSEALLSTLTQIHKTLTFLRKKNLQAYNQLNIDKDWLRQITDHPTSISVEDWEKIKELRLEILRYIQEIEKEEKEPKTDEKIIEEEKKTHKNKRFNVRDKWWPV